MVYQGLSRTVKDCQGLSRTIKDYQGLSTTIKDYQQLSMTINDYQRLSTTFNDCQGLSRTGSQKKIGFRNIAQFSLRAVLAKKIRVFMGDEHTYAMTR